MNIKWKQILTLGVVLGGAILAVKSINNTSAASSKMTAEQLLALLRSKTWSINGLVQKISNTQKLTLNADGSVNIGGDVNQYRGVLVNENTIVTKERNGKPDKEIIWKAV
jgi:hypothetical protein